MINYYVDDLYGLLAQLRVEGSAVDAKVDKSEFGKSGWVMNLEGNRVRHGCMRHPYRLNRAGIVQTNVSNQVLQRRTVV